MQGSKDIEQVNFLSTIVGMCLMLMLLERSKILKRLVSFFEFFQEKKEKKKKKSMNLRALINDVELYDSMNSEINL